MIDLLPWTRRRTTPHDCRLLVPSGLARTAVLLAAGQGERMAGTRQGSKPLIEVGGLLLIERAILALAQAGVMHFRVVVGSNAEEIGAALRGRRRLRALDIVLVHCADAHLGNGHSLAAGAAGLDAPFLLAMSDHLFDPRIAMRLQAQAAREPDRVHLATDADLAQVFDLDDATKVQADGGVIRALGKDLTSFSRVDVGVFHCPAWLGEVAARAIAAGAHSVSEVMRQAIAADAMRSCPIEPLSWQDVDTPEMLAEARRRLRTGGDPLRVRDPALLFRRLRLAGMLVGVMLLAWVLARQPFSQIAEVVASAGWSVLGVLAFPLLWYACNTAGTWVLVDGRVGLRALFYNRVAGEGLNSLLPLGGLGGEPFKVRHLARWLPEQEAATVAIASRLIEELSGVLLAGICLVVSALASVWPARWVPWVAALGVVLFAAGGAATVLLTRQAPARVAAALMRLLARPGTMPPCLPLRRVLGALAFHALGRIAGVLEVAFLLYVVGVSAGPAAIAAVYAILLLAGLATIAFPQGVGALEAASVFALGLLGAPPPVGAAFGLLRRGRMLFYGVLGTALSLLALRAPATLRALRPRPAATAHQAARP